MPGRLNSLILAADRQNVLDMRRIANYPNSPQQFEQFVFAVGGSNNLLD